MYFVSADSLASYRKMMIMDRCCRLPYTKYYYGDQTKQGERKWV